MTPEATGSGRDRDEYDNAADALADLTGRDRDEFDASEYAIPDFSEQQVVER